MNGMLRSNRGFTIVELLIVIVVIGILAAITIVAYNGIQQRARDADRMTDISSIKKAIEIYNVETGTYPAVCSGDDSGCSANLLATPLLPYIKVIPLDPQTPTKTYDYVRGPVANSSYAVKISREIGGDCKTGNNVNIYWWGSGIPLC